MTKSDTQYKQMEDPTNDVEAGQTTSSSGINVSKKQVLIIQIGLALLLFLTSVIVIVLFCLLSKVNDYLDGDLTIDNVRRSLVRKPCEEAL